MKVLLRFILAIVFGFAGAFVARVVLYPQGAFFIVLAIFSFGILGFILPELFELAGRAGIRAVAAQIVKYLQEVQPPHLSVPTLRFKRRRKASKYINPLVCDTSVLIDGRILDIARTGFLLGTLLIGDGVIRELQALSDSADSLKRGKGRRGLDVLSDLQKEKMCKVAVLAIGAESGRVDDGLVALAKKLKAGLLTLDFNLNKVARIKKVRVLNLNELAEALKSKVLPGERLRLEVRDKGKGSGQGVGYLADGTMVVVEGGLEYRGKNVEIEVLRVFQTAAGRMVFARRANNANESE
ncbi:TRAM domain-containing protein [Candidatus Curtissbacteria bacterium]|nr:TRAM domain-containing protein [Candidatus Curtissbacteria bacterium]